MDYCIFSEFRDEIVSCIYGSLKELKEHLKEDVIDLKPEENETNLIIYKMEPTKFKVKTQRILKK